MNEQKVKAIDWYLQWAMPLPAYVNTPEENTLVDKFATLYSMAFGAQQMNELANVENIKKWRKAYLGTLKALNRDGSESERGGRQLRKIGYEFVESKIDNSIPSPKMTPKYKSDLPLVEVTENFLQYEIDNIFNKYLNDRSERATYIDGTSWYKIWWDSLDNSDTTSGNVKIDVKLADQIVPQPGILDWRKLEYIFELEQVSLSRIYQLTGRRITPISGDTSQKATEPIGSDNSTITMITCYYLNEDRIVGRFAWSQHSRQVIFNDHDWQIRRVRKCQKCGQIVPQNAKCPICGSKSFKYEPVNEEMLDEDLYQVYNPYEVGETDDENEKDHYATRLFATKGTKIPFYHLRQLPFVPRPAVSSINSIYGISEIFILLDMQDVVNKMYTKMTDKTMQSGAVLTKPKRLKINDTDEGIRQVDVNTIEEASMITTKQIAADTSQDITAAALLYDSARASSGVTESFQGSRDTTAVSGKAKEFAAAQSAGRIESLRVMKAAAFADVYELVLKYLLAFSDEPRKFVKVLPDGNVEEETWNKYMFLAKDKYGNIYYRDDFKFGSDPVATLSQNRVAMWQETQTQFMQGTLGDVSDPRTRELFWNIMEQQQYPLAKLVLAGIKDNVQHLPAEIEQLLLQNPNVLQMVMQQLQDANLMAGSGSGQQGGARPNSGPEGNGLSHEANVEVTNERNRAKNNQAQFTGGSLTGGTIE